METRERQSLVATTVLHTRRITLQSLLETPLIGLNTRSHVIGLRFASNEANRRTAGAFQASLRRRYVRLHLPQEKEYGWNSAFAWGSPTWVERSRASRSLHEESSSLHVAVLFRRHSRADWKARPSVLIPLERLDRFPACADTGDLPATHPTELVGRWVRSLPDARWGDTLELRSDASVGGSTTNRVPATARWSVRQRTTAISLFCATDSTAGSCRTYQLNGDLLILDGGSAGKTVFRRAPTIGR